MNAHTSRVAGRVSASCLQALVGCRDIGLNVVHCSSAASFTCNRVLHVYCGWLSGEIALEPGTGAGSWAGILSVPLHVIMRHLERVRLCTRCCRLTSNHDIYVEAVSAAVRICRCYKSDHRHKIKPSLLRMSSSAMQCTSRLNYADD